MKRKLTYEAPLTEEFAVALEGSCLQAASPVPTMTPGNPENPMPWGNPDED